MELRRREHSVSLWLLPCQFASGYERTAASRLGVDKLEGPSNSAGTWRALGQEKTDCALQLGGDLLFGRRIAKCSGAPLLCYAYGFKKGMEHAQVFTAYAGMATAIDSKRGGSAFPLRVIGDLVKDSLSLETGTFKWDSESPDSKNSRGRPPRLLFFPGSRPAIRRLSLGWLTAIAERLKILIPEVRIGTLFSPFAQESEFPLWAEAGLNPLKVGAGSAMKSADYALTQPGTNTLEMMHCGLPALVAAPTDFLKVIPVGGLGGYVTGIPLIGTRIKERAIRGNLKRYNGFISWPNRIANRMILDEAAGKLTPQDLANRVAAALRDEAKLSRVHNELLALSGENGAVVKLCDAVERAVG
jgi:lipid-A-disaccharide synthase